MCTLLLTLCTLLLTLYKLLYYYSHCITTHIVAGVAKPNTRLKMKRLIEEVDHAREMSLWCKVTYCMRLRHT